jgi:hypothetical protein
MRPYLIHILVKGLSADGPILAGVFSKGVLEPGQGSVQVRGFLMRELGRERRPDCWAKSTVLVLVITFPLRYLLSTSSY